MTNTTGFDAGQFHAELNTASAALQDFASGPARRAADEVGAAFDRAGARIAGALGKAARDGEISFKRLAKVVLEEIARLALDRILTQGGGNKGLSFFGARAAGGSVTPGGAYLVGERGPELFTPNTSGAIGAASGTVAVHFHLGAGADVASITRHQGQIAAAIARAVAYGRRNL